MALPIVAYRHGALMPAIEARLRDLYELVAPDAPEAATGRVLVTTGGSGADADLIARLPALELIAVNGVGYDAVDRTAADARGIAISNTPDVLTDDVADLALALLLATARRLPAADRFVRSGEWAAGGSFPLAHRVSGKRLGIVGLGRIGQAIARRAVPFVGDIAYHTRHVVAGVPWRHVADVRTLAAEVDILVIIAPATPQTTGMIDRAVLDALGPSGMLINVARGSLVNEPALVSAIEEGRLGAAGLDVFADEPNVPQALIDSDRVVLLPHIGSATAETRTAMGELVLANVAAHFAGEPLPSVVLPLR